MRLSNINCAAEFAIYIHLPYCAYKCPYCDFNAYAVKTVPEKQYLAGLFSELEFYKNDPRFSGRSVSTLYFGGGTPSLFSAGAIDQLVTKVSQAFSNSNPIEITLEANPGELKQDYLQILKQAGVTRLSLGVQSFNSRALEVLGRKHSAEDVREAVKNARKAGFTTLSLDLIYAVPGQSFDDLQIDIQQIIHLEPDHISAYGLTVEPGTPLFQSVERGVVIPVDSDTQAEMYSKMIEVLKSAGFLRYEISNFSKPGYESKHNSGYWRGIDYIGLGAGAHSYYCNYSVSGQRNSAVRWSNIADPKMYSTRASALLSAEPPITSPFVAWREELTTRQLVSEFFFVGLRGVSGVLISDFVSAFGLQPEEIFKSEFRKLQSAGLITVDAERVILTDSGYLMADGVFAEFV